MAKSGIVRKDPVPRKGGIQGIGGSVRNPNPNKTYCLVPPNLVEDYESQEYVLSRKQEDGSGCSVVGASVGSDGTFKYKGLFLMERDAEISRAVYEEGQAHIDAIERRIVTKQGGIEGDAFRGMPGRGKYFDVRNHTSAEAAETQRMGRE